MGDFQKLFGTSAKREREGVWHEVGDGVRVLVARANNPGHAEAIERLTKPYRGMISRGTLPRDKAEAISTEALAQGVLLGWEGVELDGQPVAYTKDNAVKLLSDFKDFRELIAQLATEAAQYREEEIQAAEKNS